MAPGAVRGERPPPSLLACTVAAWLVLVAGGLGAPFVLLLDALLTARPFESGGAPAPPFAASTGLLLAARVTATVAMLGIVALGVVARRHGWRSVGIRLPAALAALAALVLWALRPA